MNRDVFSDQVAFESDSFADNPEPRCPCLLILDTSYSMSGQPIRELNEGLKSFKEELISDSLAMKRVEVAVISFGPVKVQSTFQTVENFSPPELHADGSTPMGEAIEKGLELLKLRKNEYKTNGISFYRPWVFLITDGEPTDDWEKSAKLVHDGEANKSFAFFSVGVGDANVNLLQHISVREPLKLDGLKFRELFQWLSNSMKSVSQSTPGTSVAIESPIGWAEV